MSRRIAVLYHPAFRDFAGAELVAAWALQTLQSDHDTILWCEQMPDFKRVDARFGTTLAANPPLRVVLPTRLSRWLIGMWPGEGRVLALSMVARALGRIERRWRPHLWVSTCNETWMPQRGFQYIHWSENASLALPSSDWSWLKRMGFTLSQTMAWRLGLHRMVSPDQHYSVANSTWTRNELLKGRDQVGIVYPPVPPFDAGLPWEEREDRVVILGRWHWLKRMDLAIDLVAKARQAGAKTLRLAFAGFWHGSEEERSRLQARCERLAWVEWYESLDRDALQQLVGSSRYGLHAMLNEHFGIAVAEMMTAGCVVLVHDSGGPPEIVQDRRQVYRDAQDGGRILHGIWHSPTLQKELHLAARLRGLKFSPERFSHALNEKIHAFETSISAKELTK